MGAAVVHHRRTRVFVIDPHPVFRRGLRASLEAEDFDMTGDAGSLDAARPPPTDILVAADDVPLCSVRDRFGSDVRVVVTFHMPDPGRMADCLEWGAAAVLMQADLTPASLARTVRSVAAGATLLPTELVPNVLESARRGASMRRWLDERDVLVLSALAEGLGTREIADRLAYSERTIKNVVHGMLAKMNCRNRTQAVAVATRQGVI